MSKNFRSLKNIISDHLNNLDMIDAKQRLGKGEFIGFGLTATGDHACSQRRNSSLTLGQPQVWRPHRGLPERAVAWLFEHFLHLYPTDTDKQMLAKQTGLTRNQVHMICTMGRKLVHICLLTLLDDFDLKISMTICINFD